MPHCSSPTRNTPAAFLRRSAGLFLVALLTVPAARAQRSVDLAFSYAQQQSKLVGSSSSTDNFSLRGATVDLGYGLWHSFGVALAANGLTVNNPQQSIDIQQASFMLGPRYTANFGRVGPEENHRRLGVFVDAKLGFTFATSGLYPTGTSALSSHAAGFTYSTGGGVNLHVFRQLDVRLAQIEYVQSHLPNGGSNQQNNIRYSAGINFHFGR